MTLLLHRWRYAACLGCSIDGATGNTFQETFAGGSTRGGGHLLPRYEGDTNNHHRCTPEARSFWSRDLELPRSRRDTERSEMAAASFVLFAATTPAGALSLAPRSMPFSAVSQFAAPLQLVFLRTPLFFSLSQTALTCL